MTIEIVVAIALLAAATIVVLGGGKLVSITNSKTTTALTQRLQAKLPQRLSRWSAQIASAAWATFPQQTDFTLDQWASYIAAILDNESGGGSALSPSNDPSGVGDFTNRWRANPPSWAQTTGQTRLTPKGTLYEIRPPKPFSDRPAAWGYGLMQIDYEFDKTFIINGAWRNADSDILRGAQILQAKYAMTKNITDAIARYNGRGDAAALYAQRTLTKASGFGIA